MENDQQAVLSELQAENARLIGLLEAHGIEWRVKLPAPVVTHPTSITPLSTAEKVTLFRSLFQGRTDVYPIRWESKATGKSGYSPVCGNEWQPGICHKPKVKCADCEHRLLMPVTDTVIYAHLSGAMTAGVYPLLEDDACYFLAVDFDEKEWRDDVRAFLQSCRTLGVPAVLEISRSGNGAHAWIFFTRKVSARDARRLGTALLRPANKTYILRSGAHGRSATYKRPPEVLLATLRAANKTPDAGLCRLAVLFVLSASARLASAVKLGFVSHS
ncbi:TOTE conflict system archaeo-eukaryotic primase domain-containing protein [Chromobacterium phragmitis]|uniref:TOTE conflict system archaeo-eukaryotic primase domain-containing protein n=1 Tax=Chromobacterium phragmitis TaxID=2202141 RepID=UPI0011AE705E|nr:DNA primase [Chromobacterium phragmitis]